MFVCFAQCTTEKVNIFLFTYFTKTTYLLTTAISVSRAKTVNISQNNFNFRLCFSCFEHQHRVGRLRYGTQQQNGTDINNVSSMVSSTKSNTNDCEEPNLFQLEYRTVVGYLGTIEMPKQIVSNSKFQTVRSCIRKMRQEKRQPTVVLMQILPNCLKLYNADNVLLAKYPAGRLSYVSSNHSGSSAAPAAAMAANDGDMRFFGLVTSATYADGRICDWASATAATSNGSDVIVSNSCHVFVIDLKLIDHAEHFTVTISIFFYFGSIKVQF